MLLLTHVLKLLSKESPRIFIPGIRNMENFGEWEKMKSMINELMAEGRDYANQLQSQLNSASSSQETREELAKKILESYQKSLTLMNSGESGGQNSPHCHGGSSPKSEDSDQDHQVIRSKKAMPRWKHKVRITPGAGIDTTLDDGFSWRKYGQKDILGAKFPRGYYRCTHRHSQGCLATKQVQRSDDDTMLFDVTYRGTHTCSQAANNVGSSSTFPIDPSVQDQEPNPTSQELDNLRGNLRVVTEGLEIDHHGNQQHRQLLHFPSSTNPNPAGDSNAYHFVHATDNSGLYGNGYSNHGGDYNFSMPHGGMNEFHDIISASPSTSNSPTAGFDSPYGNAAFDPNFSFGRFGGFFS
ncbi:PREDICTED: probable WRKY transcription factor 30 [Tarenaya hassleriana]|uniref:probable WRKY transcription factor 30 n=1 Tax=Tarenaya hassleriana TaxID=28532 RepID=UPI00053C35D6|nr:PREDICTED: probable WRKY transcription factor 30 [Tarenaya hassleriana]